MDTNVNYQYKNIKYKNGYPVCHARLHKQLARVLLGFRLGLGVRDSVGGAVIVVRHRFFNRHLDVPWEQVVLIHLQTLFQLHEEQGRSTTLRASHIRPG